MLNITLRLAIAFLAAIATIPGIKATLPSASLTTLNGRNVNASTLSNGGKPFVISFFATWCKPCLRELKAIAEVYPEWQEETGMKLVAISIDDAQKADRVKPLVESEGWEYEVLLDTKGELSRAVGVKLIPFLIIVDGKGNIVYRHQGYTDGGEDEIIEKIRSLNESE